MKSVLIKIFCMVSLFTLTISQVKPEEDHSLMMKANEAYQNEDYAQAITIYTEIIDHGNAGAVLYYNLGNAYYKAGENARALLWYERALRLDPHNEDIKHNILFVNRTLVDNIDIMPEFFLNRWWKAISMSMTSGSWAVLSIICSFLFFTAIAVLLISRKPRVRTGMLIASIIFLIGLIFSIVFAYQENARYIKNPEAIIMQSVVTAKSTPNRSGNDLFVIHEGLKVQIADQVGEWYEIRLSNGEKGWIEQQSLEVI